MQNVHKWDERLVVVGDSRPDGCHSIAMDPRDIKEDRRTGTFAENDRNPFERLTQEQTRDASRNWTIGFVSERCGSYWRIREDKITCREIRQRDRETKGMDRESNTG